MIASDANSMFIDTILEHHGLKQYVSVVSTNPFYIEDGKYRM